MAKLMRKLTQAENKLLDKLLLIAKLEIDTSHLLVRPLDDGGMGSLAFGENYDSRQYGQKIAEYNIKDFDGIPLLISLNIDKKGDIYELDVWKVDFSSTILLEKKGG